MDTRQIELMAWECTELLQTHTVGRLCVIEQGYPIPIPINYRVDDGKDGLHIVVRTAPRSVLGRYEGLASLEVDDIDLDRRKAWSIIARGVLRRVTGSHDLPDPNPLLTEGRQQWITLTTSAISGRRFDVRRADDGFSVAWQLAST